MSCPNCSADNKQLLTVLQKGTRYKCKECDEIFVEWNKGILYNGTEEFNLWYAQNREFLYDIAVQSMTDIVEFIQKKDWSEKYKIVAINIAMENLKAYYEGELNIIKDMEIKINKEMKYR